MSVETCNDSSVETLRSFVANRSEPQWLREVREAAVNRFAEMEWPTSQDEEFRRTDVSMYTFDDYGFEIAAGADAEVENPVGHSGSMTFSNTAGLRRSMAEGLQEKGVVFVSLQAAINGAVTGDLADKVKNVLLRGLENADNRIAVWHYATMTHGAILYVPRFVELKDPFVVTFDESGDEVLRSPQIVAIADEGARFTVVHRSRGAEEGEVLFNEAVDLHVGNAGRIDCFGLQNVNIDSSYFSNGFGSVGRDATLHVYTGAFGGLLSKYRYDVHMDGAGGDAFIGGVYFPHEDQHVDLRTVQHHVDPNAHSLTLYKGAVTDEAHSVYQGLISVNHDALNTDAYLTNNNIVLGDDARADSIPTLEIHTDEVRCSHGSTIGKLDDSQIFYLNTRGYSPEEAKHLLVQGFFEEVVGNYPEVVVDDIHEIVEKRIALDQE
ncbi:MAG: Fe-S cluster assembly protein SufD [Alkalispirochaeta sp.]